MESSLTVIGSKGSVKIGGQYMDKVEYAISRIMNFLNYHRPILQTITGIQRQREQPRLHHRHVVDTLKERNTLTTNALEGLKVVEIIERIKET